MKKRISIALVCALFLGICSITAAALNQTNNGNWTFVSSDYFWQVPIKSTNPILVEHLQDTDYSEIDNQLIDTSGTPDLTAATTAAEDPDAALPDNMLSDGRILKENWRELKSKLLADAVKVTSLGDEKASIQKFNTVLPQSNSDITLNMQKISTGDSSIFIPQTPDDFPASYIVTPDGKITVICTGEGIWTLSGTDETLQKITPDTYNGKTYSDLVKESVHTYGTNQVCWSGQISSSPDSTKIAYVSNKNNLSKYSVFVSDLEAKTEKPVICDESFNYFVDSWIDANTILCYKLNDKDISVVAVTLGGKEISLNLGVEKPTILSTKDGLIAYTTPNCNEIRVVKFNGTSTPELITSKKLDGTLRIRPGIHAFSPDASKLAYIFVPNNEPLNRYLSILDLKSGNVFKNNSFPENCNSSAAILEISWINDDSLLTIISEKGENSDTYSTWVYSLNRGDEGV